MKKKKRYFYTTNRLGIDDSDVISNPHGISTPERTISDELRKIRKILKEQKVETESRKRQEISFPRLSYEFDLGKAIYWNQNEKSYSGEFGKGNNDTQILEHLINNHKKTHTTSELTEIIIKTPRSGAEYSDPGRRVLDAIAAIRQKLGNKVIIRANGGYSVQCNVVKR